MLKDSEAVLKRRKLSSLMSAPPTTTTPPTTPPTPPPLNMMMLMSSSTMNTPTHAVSAAQPLDMTPPLPPHSALAATSILNAVAASNTAAVAAGPAPSTPTASTPAGTATSLVQDHYSLRWNNHQNHILRAFDALLQTKTLVDVTLVCAETSIRAHKMVLSACSPFFQRVFAETPCKHPVIVLKDFRGWVVQAIVDFMYRGEISVPQERLQTLIQAGESLQVRGLVESSMPEHAPTPAASPDDFGMLDTSLMSSELGRCSSFDDESPSMVTAGSKIILPSRLFGGASSRERRERKRERERERERDLEREAELMSDHELHNELNSSHPELCTSPMPRRKQARPRRRSGELSLEVASKPASPIPQEEEEEELEAPKPTPEDVRNAETLETVIKREINDEAMEEGQENEEHNEQQHNAHDMSEKHFAETDQQQHSACLQSSLESNTTQQAHMDLSLPATKDEHEQRLQENELADDDEEHEDEDEYDDMEQHHEPEDIEELINTSTELRRKSNSGLSDGPEDLCTTKKDNEHGGQHSSSEHEGSPTNNNNNNKLNNNNNRIVLSLKDIRHLNKPGVCNSTSRHSSTPNSTSSMNPFAAASLRDLRLDRSGTSSNCNNAAENQCKMEALEAQMHAAAAAAAAAAVNGENPFQHMEHQMDLSFAAAAAAAAVSHQQSRERDQQMQREQRELQEHHNAYANSILGQMGMGGMPPFGHGGPGVGPQGGQSAHERLEESMNRLSKEFTPTSPMSLPSHFNAPDGQPHPPSPLPFPGMSSALNLTPPHMFGLDSPLGLFPPGIDPGKLYNPLMEMSDPRGMGGDPPPFLKKKMPRPKGQHSAPRGGPPRSWTNAELTEALQHVWNKKMTTSQASRIFGIPYNSLLMYVRGKYGKSLKLEQLRKDCISGPPLELLQMGLNTGGNSSASNNNNSNSNKNNKQSGEETRERSDSSTRKDQQRGGSNSTDMDLSAGNISGDPRSASSEPDLLGGPNALFNPFPPGFYPDFSGGFPGLPLSMLNLLPPAERHQHAAAAAAAMHHMSMDEDCKSDRSKQSSSMDEEYAGSVQPLALHRDDATRRSEMMGGGTLGQQNGGAAQD